MSIPQSPSRAPIDDLLMCKREATKLEKMRASRINVERERAKLEEVGAEPHVLAYLSMAVISLDEQILQTDDEPGSVGC